MGLLNAVEEIEFVQRARRKPLLESSNWRVTRHSSGSETRQAHPVEDPEVELHLEIIRCCGWFEEFGSRHREVNGMACLLPRPEVYNGNGDAPSRRAMHQGDVGAFRIVP